MRSIRRGELVAFVLAVTTLVFAPSLPGGFSSDDHTLIEHDPRIADPSRWLDLLASPFWAFDMDDASTDAAYAHIHRPMVKVAFLVGQVLSGGSPLGFHAVTLTVHLVVVALVFRFLERRRLTPNGAMLGALLFALHPSRVESVAWISGISDPLMLLFVLLAAESVTRWESTRRLVAVCVFSFLATASKEPAILLAPSLVGLELGSEPRSARLRAMGAAVAGSAIALGIAAIVTSGAVSVARTFGLARPFATLGSAVVRTIWPFPITLDPYPFAFDARGVRLLPQLEFGVGIGVFVVLVVLAFAALRRERLRPFAYAVAVFFLGVAPVLGFEGRGAASLFSDRFLYGPILGIAWLVGLAFDRVPEPRRRFTALVVAACILATAVPTTDAIADFTDERVWNARERERQPRSARWCVSVASQQAAAADDYARAIELRTPCVALATRLHDRSFELNLVLWIAAARVRGTPDRELPETRGLRDALVSFFETGRADVTVLGHRYRSTTDEDGLRVGRRQTGLVHLPIAALDIRLGDYDSAARWAERATRITPRLPDAWITWLTALARAGRFADARRVLGRAHGSFTTDSEFLVGFEQALGRAETASHAIATEPERTIAVATALADHASVLRALGSRCDAPDGAEVTMVCAREAMAIDDRDRALATLEARARIAPAEAAQIAELIARLRAMP